MSTKRHKSFARLPLALAVMSCLYGPQLLAQQADDEADDSAQETEQPKELERVTVTGSLISRLGFDSVSPVQIITADVSATTGQLDTASILQTSNVAAGSTQISNQFSGFVIEGGNGVQTLSLRGLGANRTLVLLDGRRPGPAGTRGQVGAFDLNVIPSVILQRAELLKDGGGSIYGSDAVAGVVNLITRKNIDRTILTAETIMPQEAGGSRWSVAGATGFNFDNGSITASFQHWDQEPLKIGDRDFFRCPQDLVRDASGNLIDRQDRSAIGNTPLGGCNNLYANTVIAGALRYVPSPDGVTIGPLPGYRPRQNRNAVPGTSPAFYEDILNFDFFGATDVFAAQERTSLFTTADFSFGDINWNSQLLYTNRETQSRRFRQFFPVVDGRSVGLPSRVQPVMPFRSNQNIDVDFLYLASGLNGGFGADSSWSWRFDATYSRSDGDYEVLAIDRNLTGDLNQDSDGGGAPINYFDPRILDGRGMDGLEAAVGLYHTGNTVYTQATATGIISGDLFELPAGTAGLALGTEFRRISIDDTPSDFEQAGRAWGQSSAQVTRGKDYVSELFGELEVPLLAGLPLVESLVFNGSARVFKYDTVADSDYVWKAGMRWQIIPSVSLRATNGTSYRAPGLYELFLGNLTGFANQLGLDPCIDWGNSNNPNIRANCAAAGIPADYTGAGSSATIVQGGGAGVLNPETSRSLTAGLVFTPEFANLSASIDYFEIEVKDEISTLGSGAIVGNCYALPVFPNEFCSLFDRAPATADFPFNITEVRASFINLNRQLVRGYDLNVRWDGDFTFGKLEVESQFTYTMEDVQRFFNTAAASGFDSDDRNGQVSRPELVGNIRTALTRGDFTYTWGMRYVGETDNAGPAGGFVPPTSYFGNPNPVYDSVAEDVLYHSLSVQYRAADWDLLVGIDNVLDEEPPTMSAGAGSTRFGNIPAFATQYDWLGRSLFARFNYRF